MTREPFPLTTGLPSIARYGNGSAGPPPTRPARGTSLSPGPGRSSMIRARRSAMNNPEQGHVSRSVPKLRLERRDVAKSVVDAPGTQPAALDCRT
jgi:hypothetical protein